MNSQKKIRLAIFDDHPAIIDSIVRHFSEKKEIELIAHFSVSCDLLDFLEKEEVDFLILDVLTCEEIGLSLFETVYTKYKNTKVIAFTSIKSEFLCTELYNYGVISILNKREPMEKLSDLILNFSDTNHLNKNRVENKKLCLTPKEKVIAKHLAQGLLAKEIADITHSSVNTIQNQKNSLLEKFECGNTTELVYKLTQVGLIDPF